MKNLLIKTQKSVKRNAPALLSTISAVGVVSTAVLTAKATPKALQLLQQAKEEKNEELLLSEKVMVMAPAYIPATLVGVSTIACIFGAHVLNKKQKAALTSAYMLLNTSYKEYQNKVKEMYGEGEETAVRVELAKDKAKEQEVTHEDDGKTLFYDEYSQRYFRATNETVLRAQYIVNKEVTTNFYATINEFYKLVGLDPIDGGEIIGWTSTMMYETYWTDWVDFWHERVELEDGMECYILHFTEPFPDVNEDY